MNPVEELYHTVLQKLIIMFLGLLTVTVLMTSCTAGAKSCSAYDSVELVEDETSPHRY